MADVDFRRRSRSLRAAEAVIEVVVAMFYVYIYISDVICVYVVQRVSFCFVYFILSNVKYLFFIYTQTSFFLSLSLGGVYAYDYRSTPWSSFMRVRMCNLGFLFS